MEHSRNLGTGKLRQEDQEFKAMLGYIVSLKSFEPTWDPISKNKKEEREGKEKWKKNLPCSPWAVGKIFLLVAVWGTNMRLAWGLVHHWMSDGKKRTRQGERINHSVPSTISAFRRSLTWGISLVGFALSPKLLDHFPFWVLLLLPPDTRLEFLRFPSLAIHMIRVTLQLQVSLCVLSFRASHLSSVSLHVLMLSNVSSGTP